MAHYQDYKSKMTAYSGVANWLIQNLKWLKYSDPEKQLKMIIAIMVAFLKSIDVEPVRYNKKGDISLNSTAQLIQVRFLKFMQWVAANKEEIKNL